MSRDFCPHTASWWSAPAVALSIRSLRSLACGKLHAATACCFSCWRLCTAAAAAACCSAAAFLSCSIHNTAFCACMASRDGRQCMLVTDGSVETTNPQLLSSNSNNLQLHHPDLLELRLDMRNAMMQLCSPVIVLNSNCFFQRCLKLQKLLSTVQHYLLKACGMQQIEPKNDLYDCGAGSHTSLPNGPFRCTLNRFHGGLQSSFR